MQKGYLAKHKKDGFKCNVSCMLFENFKGITKWEFSNVFRFSNKFRIKMCCAIKSVQQKLLSLHQFAIKKLQQILLHGNHIFICYKISDLALVICKLCVLYCEKKH